MSGQYTGVSFTNGRPVAAEDLSAISVISKKYADLVGLVSSKPGWVGLGMVVDSINASMPGDIIVGPGAGSLKLLINTIGLKAASGDGLIDIVGNNGVYQEITIPDNDRPNPGTVYVFLESWTEDVDASGTIYRGGNVEYPEQTNELAAFSMPRDISIRSQRVYKFRSVLVDGSSIDTVNDALVAGSSTIDGIDFSIDSDGNYTANTSVGIVYAVPLLVIHRLGWGSFGSSALDGVYPSLAGGLLNQSSKSGYSVSDRPDGFLHDVIYPGQCTIVGRSHDVGEHMAKDTMSAVMRGLVRNTTRGGMGSYGMSTYSVQGTLGVGANLQIGRGLSVISADSKYVPDRDIAQVHLWVDKSQMVGTTAVFHDVVMNPYEINVSGEIRSEIFESNGSADFDLVPGTVVSNPDGTISVTVSQADMDRPYGYLSVYCRIPVRRIEADPAFSNGRVSDAYALYYRGGLFASHGKKIPVGGNWQTPVSSVSSNFLESVPTLDVVVSASSGFLRIPLVSGKITCGNYSYEIIGVNSVNVAGSAVDAHAGITLGANELTISSVHIQSGDVLVRLYAAGIHGVGHNVEKGGLGSILRIASPNVIPHVQGSDTFVKLRGVPSGDSKVFDRPMHCAYYNGGGVNRLIFVDHSTGITKHSSYDQGALPNYSNTYEDVGSQNVSGLTVGTHDVTLTTDFRVPVVYRAALSDSDTVILMSDANSEQRVVGSKIRTYVRKSWVFEGIVDAYLRTSGGATMRIGVSSSLLAKDRIQAPVESSAIGYVLTGFPATFDGYAPESGSVSVGVLVRDMSTGLKRLAVATFTLASPGVFSIDSSAWPVSFYEINGLPV